MLYVSVAAWVYNHAVFEPLAAFTQEFISQLPPDLLKRLMDENERSESHIAIPFTLRLEPPQRYDIHSPEWQRFIKISQDKALVKRIERG
jgi:hypothetical protein